MIKCRNMQKAAPPAWQPWQSCQRAAALIKQYDDGLIENKLREREREEEGASKSCINLRAELSKVTIPFTVTIYRLP